MKSSFNPEEKNSAKTSCKIKMHLLVFVMLFSFLAVSAKPVQAQMAVVDVPQTTWQKITEQVSKLWNKYGSAAFQSTVRTAVSKIAYDTATYLAAGDKGQKPLFITQDWGDYLTQISDEAAGQFIESFANNLATTQAKDIKKEACQNTYQECSGGCFSSIGSSDIEGPAYDQSCIQGCKDAATACDKSVDDSFNANSTGSTSIGGSGVTYFDICQPSSLQAKIKISLGLVQYQRSTSANCTASKMIENWDDEIQKYQDMKKEDFLNKFSSFFNPTSNDLGIYMSVQEGLLGQQTIASENNKLQISVNKGWKNKTNAAKKLIGVPGDAEAKRDSAGNLLNSSAWTVTKDILVDTANIFLNQYAITKFNDLMSNLTKKAADTDEADVNDKETAITYGEGKFKESIASIIKPNFGSEADYDILSQLTICLDKDNPKPDNCVIDSKFAQAISEKKTVAEAIADGYIHGDWQISKDTIENAYSLRNVSVLRKYRILPIGWEEAINRAYSNPNDVKKVTISDLVSCFDINDSYNQFSVNFDVHNQAWCRGLVDPNWVLKAPLNYCRKQGNGGQISNKTVTPSIAGTNGSDYTPSSLEITRDEEYCADNQTCIKEKSDGSCEVYGYCNEEKRTWNFSGDSCDPIYNTCRKFTNSTTGKSFSYLENTLDYSGCNADSAGCRRYSVYGSYATSTGTITWNSSYGLYLNKNVSACNSKDEGCNEFLRVKPTWGANMVMDADYGNEAIGLSATGTANLNDWQYWSSSNTINGSRVATIVDSNQEPGGSTGKALKLTVNRTAGNSAFAVVGTFSDVNNSLLPDNFQLVPGQSYTVSADVYLAEGHMAHLYQGQVEDGFINSTNVSGSWQHLSITRVASGSYSEPYFGINADTDGDTVIVYIKNLKFEASNFGTGFSAYGANKFYEKIIPPYLEKSCYKDATSATKDYSLRDDAPSACSKYARKCNQSEVGCELYTGVDNSLSVSAQVSAEDYCPGECLGYDVYISKESSFHSPQSENIIPSTAAGCSVEAAGCSEFTNLDAAAQGGENKEYYSFLKQCIKPNTDLCGSFYSWEGTESGYQLRSYSLKKDAQGNPAVTANDSTLCSAEIYHKPLSDPSYNADCREFYNASGQVSYHLISRTITCSDDCHAYRLSDKNIDKTLTQAQCNAVPASRHWDGNIDACYVCLNGGVWDNTLNACVYQAIPGEGQSCSIQENGCREYNGANGNNTRMISSFDYEGGAQGWTSNCIDGLQVTSVSNDKDGHSLFYKDNANNCAAIGNDGQAATSKNPLITKVIASANVAGQYKVGTAVTAGKAYTLRFIAKAAADTHVQIYFYNNNQADPKKAEFATSTLVVKGGGEWSVYQANLENLNHEVAYNEVLVISADHDFYFDDVVLTEITDRYYLIAGSSQIPDICYYDTNDVFRGENYNLGCSQYLDRNNLKHDLRRFSKLCSGASVGCEQLISTQNYSPYDGNIWNDDNNNGRCDSGEDDCVKVDRDEAIYAVYDSSKRCNSADSGCSLLGQQTSTGSAWSDVYKKNDPNYYDSMLCGAGEVGCEAWKGDDGVTNYFRDPGNEACQYRASQDPTIAGKAWYKIPVMRCDKNNDGKISGLEKSGAVCSTDSECSGKPCMIDTNDYLCSTSYLKTFGLGGAGNQVPTPDQQAGLCEAASSGCTEYIDPVSQFSPNLVYNPSYESSANGQEGWSAARTQTVNIEPNRLYIFSTRNNSSTEITRLTFSGNVRELLADNTLATSTMNITIPAQTNASRIFFSLNNYQVLVTGGASGKTIEIKSAITDYQLQENIDKESCNGAVNLDNGCVLFNERSISGSSGLSDLSGKYDAQASKSGQAPVACTSSVVGSCTANELIKVRPNRVCSKWLDCITYTKDPETGERVCYAVGECTRLDDKNECVNFENVGTDTISFSSGGQNKNATGYYLLGKYHLGNMSEAGINSDAHYDFEDSVPALSCARVDGGECSFDKNIVSDLLVREPEKATADYPAHGASYLEVPAAYLISPQSKNSWTTVLSSRDYFINFLVNTKNTGLGARIKIVGKASDTGQETTVANEIVYSNSGWSRKIVHFNTGDNKVVKIYLGASDSASDRSVYFDDLNIEPVLEIGADASGNKQYAARECRLYPTNDSLTCVNKNDNVLKDGWEGYCLEHDPDNPGVCQLWYPVDAISSSLTTRNSSGYQGKFPLNYCTEVDGNFDLVEKRVLNKFWDGGQGDDPLDENPGAGVYYQEWENCSSTPTAFGVTTSGDCNCGQRTDFCPFGYMIVDAREGNNHRAYCVPKRNYLGDVVQQRTYAAGEGSSCTITYYEGWAVYDGLDYKKYNGNCNNNSQPVACTNLDESENADPPVRVYDYNHEVSDEDDLKLISGSDPEKNFRLTCNRFIQAVDYNGDNMAWAVRTGINSAWATTTPPYFAETASSGVSIFYGNVNGSEHKLSAYGRNRQDTPFGAAAWPDDFSLLSSEAVSLRDQYSSKNDEEIFAGRPYGCSNYKSAATEKGKGCKAIGYCSLDPNVYCLLGNGSSTDYVSRRTCASGGYGYCIPLWSNYLGKSHSSNNGLKDFEVILRSLFLKSYNSYVYSDGAYSPSGLDMDYSNIGSCPNGSRPEARYNSASNSIASFCAIDPKIGDRVVIKYNNQIIATSGTFYIPKKGVYSLEFNTIIDPEQQPLKEIYIAWGDGETEQLITGQDSRPSEDNPHVFYHYYKKTGSNGIMINIRDNWGKVGTYGTCTFRPGVCLPAVLD